MKEPDPAKIEDTMLFVYNFDKREIYNQDKYSFWRIHYENRINEIISQVQSQIESGKVLEVGCAQANICLLLAELGYETYAVDIRSDFLRYSRLKHERGKIFHVCASGLNLPFKENTFDVIILGELLEHVAEPQNLLISTLRSLSNEGVLIITTPNASSLLEHHKTFKEAKDDIKKLKAKQFGPAGDDHLFLFTSSELKEVVIQNNFQIIESKFLNTWLLNRFSYKFYRFIPLEVVRKTNSIIAKIPYLNKWISLTLMVTAKPKGD